MCKECLTARNKYEVFNSVQLEIYADEIDSVADGMEAYTAPEKMSGANKYMCETCDKQRTAYKSLQFLSTPNLLIVTLKRFKCTNTGQAYKIDKHVSFDESLVMSKYMCRKGENVSYTLVGVLVHLGRRTTTQSGHYICYVRNLALNQWHVVDDERVRAVKKEEVLQQQAYCLFYVRNVAAPLPGWDPAKYISTGKRRHRAKASTENNDQPVLCVDGCGFFGDPKNEGRCSLCHKKHQASLENMVGGLQINGS